MTDPFYGTGREIPASGHVTDAARFNLSNVSDPFTTQGTVAPTSRMLGGTPSSCAVKGVQVERVPLVEFIAERRHGWKQEHLAHASTGRNRETGECKIAVAVRRRHNGLVHFDADLFRLDYNLSQDTIARLYRHWHDLNAAHSLSKRVLRRMDCHFGKTTIIFDATAEQTDHWRRFLRRVLTDAVSYTRIEGLPARGRQ